MTDAKPIPPKGSTSYDLLRMPDEEFELMCARLVKLEFPNAFKPANTQDGGADMVLPREGSGYERCWQAKHYTDRIRWEKCEESLVSALANWEGITEYTFVFPRELTNNEQKTFDKKFRSPDAKVEVNQWNGEDLQRRLTGSEQGARVARTFFSDAELDQEKLQNAIEVGGQLATGEDALDRLGNIGDFLASSDAYFSYPAATHEADQPGPPVAPGSVMSIGESEGGVTRRIDLVPRDDEAMEQYGPEFVIEAAEGEAGRRAAERLTEALREGKGVEIGEGLDVTLTRMPPAFEGLVGQRLTGGTVQVGEPDRVRRRVEPFTARLSVETGAEKASVDVELAQVEKVPEGWNDAFIGEVGGMTVTQLFRETEDGGEIRWNFRHRRDSSRVADQLAALRLMTALGKGGEFEFSRVGLEDHGLRSPVQAEPVPPESEVLVAFLEAVRIIEEWSGVEFELPDIVTPEDARTIRSLAGIVQAKGMPVTWDNIEVVVATETDVHPLRDGRLIRIEREVSGVVFGRVVPLGYTVLDLPEYKVASVAPGPAQDGSYVVRLEPASNEAGKRFQHLSKEKTLAKPAASKPPPPPPRKRRKRGGRGRGKRKR